MKAAGPLALASLLAAPALAGEPEMSSGYGVRRDPVDGRRAVHRGIDLRAAAGTPVRAAADRVVRVVEWRGGYGLMVELVHPDATATRYAHLSSLWVRPSQHIAQGEPIGAVGSTGRATGNHLHFEYRVGGVAVDPLPHLGPGHEVPGPAAPPLPLVPHRSAFAAARDLSDIAPQELPDGRAALRGLVR